jgi:hypothetical protein
MIPSELQDIAKEHDIAARQIWHTIEYQFISNNETCTLHLDVMFHNFIQGDLSVSDYCRKIKSMADSLVDLGCAIFDRNLVLNVLRGLNKQYDHICAIITRSTPFPSFHKVQDDLVTEELTLGSDTPAYPLQVLYSNTTPAPSRPPGNGG